MPKSATSSETPRHRRETYNRLSETLGEGLEQNVILSPFTTFGIGGKADFFYQAKSPEMLVRAIRSAEESRLAFFVLGGGSNVLVGDSGFRGLVIKNQCTGILTNGATITCRSGAILQDVVNTATENSLSGLEFAAGIPGTLGGAIRGNAGAFGKGIGDILVTAVILTEEGDIRQVSRDYLEFGYRKSRLKHTGDVVLSATVRLSEDRRQNIEHEVEANLRRRNERIPWQSKSAGCFFKNVDDPQGRVAAGFLLEQVGAKGMCEGDARVSEQHANILINAGKATASDVWKLAQRLKEKVKQKFDKDLQEEVVYIN